jgi:antirestriction protein ArdC
LKISDVPREDHARYLRSWLKVLREDKKAIFTAASQATKAAEFLHSLQPGGSDEKDEDKSV